MSHSTLVPSEKKEDLSYSSNSCVKPTLFDNKQLQNIECDRALTAGHFLSNEGRKQKAYQTFHNHSCKTSSRGFTLVEKSPDEHSPSRTSYKTPFHHHVPYLSKNPSLHNLPDSSGKLLPISRAERHTASQVMIP